MGRRPKRRGLDIDGILILDKPSGITSNQVLQKVKRLFNANKAGHTGSLDKPATGLLPICLGEATKLSAYLLEENKEYLADCCLGIMTTTADAEGEVIATQAVPEFKYQQIESVLKDFIGEIDQIPPMFSALKHEGKRLYELAYKGETVERKKRQVVIYSIQLVSLEKAHLRIQVRCSKGTYIRTLVEDIGKKLGCGAHVQNLRRISVAQFSERDMVTLADLENMVTSGDNSHLELLKPVDAAVSGLEKTTLVSVEAARFMNGQLIPVSDVRFDDVCRVYDENNHFLGIAYEKYPGQLAPKRLIIEKSGS